MSVSRDRKMEFQCAVHIFSGHRIADESETEVSKPW